MKAVRIIVSLIIGTAVTFGLFFVMNFLVSNNEGLDRDDRVEANIRFGDVEVPEVTNTKDRNKPPPEPPPPKQPPPPPDQSISEIQPDVQNMPEIDMPTNIDIPGTGSGMYLGQPGQQDTSQDGGVIPIARFQPPYPRRAAMAQIEGYVKVEFTITESGTVIDPRVVESEPPRVFDRAALRGILRWKFKPKVVDGQRVQQRATQTLTFSLDD